MSPILSLFQEKNRLLESFLVRTREYKTAIESEERTLDEKIDLIDEISDVREQNLRVMQALDQQIENARKDLEPEAMEKLHGEGLLKEQLERTLQLIKEIQLTDQSLFLYIQSTGSEIRSRILKSLKEKEAVSKFKSQSLNPTGDEVDKTI
jgi:hypothetical protein